MSRYTLPAIVTPISLVLLSGIAQASHFPADGSPRTLHGIDLIGLLIVAFWPAQVCLALLVYRDAGERAMTRRGWWILLVSLPLVGCLVAIAYYTFTRLGDRESGALSAPPDPRPGRGRLPGGPP